MAPQDQQLSLEVGGDAGEHIQMRSTFALGGSVDRYRDQLMREDDVIVILQDADGQEIWRTEGWVKEVGFETKPRTAQSPRFTIRKHKIQLGVRAPHEDE